MLSGKFRPVVMKSMDTRRGVQWLLAIVGFCGVGCAPGNMTPLNNPPHALTPRPPEQVEMFMTARPTRSYAEVALIDGAHLPMERVRECAAHLGCDALYVDMTSRRFQQAICLVYTDPATPVTPPPPNGLWAQDGTRWNCDAGTVAKAQPTTYTSGNGEK
jgi:hypothetical protein